MSLGVTVGVEVPALTSSVCREKVQRREEMDRLSLRGMAGLLVRSQSSAFNNMALSLSVPSWFSAVYSIYLPFLASNASPVSKTSKKISRRFIMLFFS